MSLTVRAFAPQVFWVEGAVARPGIIRSELPLTLTRAIAMAGGAKTGAKTQRHRWSSAATTRARCSAFKAALSHQPGGGDPFLKSFDVVYVPQTVIASVSEFLGTYVYNLPFSAGFAARAEQGGATTVIAPGALAR